MGGAYKPDIKILQEKLQLSLNVKYTKLQMQNLKRK